MRGRALGSLAVVMASVLAACGGGDDASGSATTFSAAPVVAPADTTVPIAPPTTDPPTTTSTSTTTSTTTTTSSTTTTTPTTTLPERNCLEGSWWLSPEEVTALYANLLPGFPVTVTGSHWVDFVGNTVDFRVFLEATFAIGGTKVAFGIDQLGTGTYTLTDGVLAITYDTFESVIHDGHGDAIYDRTQDPDTYVDARNEITDNGDGTITINRVTVPVIEIPPVAGGPITCGGGDDTTMSLAYTSGIADTVAIYQRQA